MDLNPRNVLIYFIIWRVLSVFIVQTSHVPDEYWQSLEVAHKLAFGYGYLTWEWRNNIRSYIYPFLISILYKILGALQIDYPVVLILLPRVFQAVLSAYADYRFYKWTNSKWATFLLLINWYWYYCASRTLTNTVETSLTTIALAQFPFHKNSNEFNSKYLWIVAFMCAIRPTMLIMWLPLCVFHLLRTSNRFRLIKHVFTVACTTLIYSLSIDYYCSGKLILSQWEFFRINVLNDIAGFYGTHNSLWYLTSALPVLIGLHTLHLPLITYKVLKKSKINSLEFILVFTIIWTLFIYSLLKHKEFRFILPLLPAIIYICTSFESLRLPESAKKLIFFVIVVGNLVPMGYFSLVHQRGPLDVMKMLRQELASYERGSRGSGVEGNGVDVLFLTPCHAMPFYSHVHENVTMRFLTCEPDLEGREDYVDEAEEFFGDVEGWVERNFGGEGGNDKQGLPAFVVTYDNLEERLMGLLRGYRMRGEVFNSHFVEGNYGEYIRVYKRK